MHTTRRRCQGEAGSTLIVAIMVMGVAMSLSLLVVNVAIGTGRTTGEDRQRLSAVNAAEAGVDAAYAKIQSSGVLLPCAWPDYGSQDVKTSPDTTTSSATIVYTGASGATGCPLATGDVPLRAVITGTGTTSSADGKTRRMQALVDIKAVVSNGFDKGMFGDRGLTLSNNATVTPSAGQRADVYSNGDFSCSSSPTFQGSILAPTGKITMANSCSATGDVWARDAVDLSGGKTIGGRVLSATAGITATGNTVVNGTLLARSAIAWPGCALPAKCLSNQSAVPAPPTTTFPELRGDPASLAAWTAPAPGPAFEQVAMPVGTCGSAAGDWLKARVATLSRNTLYTTACAVEFRGTQNTPFSADVAVFARGGISTSNQVGLSSTTGTTRNVYFVQPFDAVPSRPCTTSPVMGPTQQFSSTPQVSVLWYSPCDISYGNQGGSYGQVYSGSTLSTNQQYTLTVRQLPVYGVTPPSTTSTVSAYALDIVYKRETR